jgi:hypothetical protein
VKRSPAASLLALGLLSVGIAACHGFEPSVRRAMSADAKCPEDKIEVKGLPGSSYQADGCGKSAVYECSWPEGGARVCTRRGDPTPKKALPGTGF